MRAACAPQQEESGLRSDAILSQATGNWGCGVFGGEPLLKALLQVTRRKKKRTREKSLQGTRAVETERVWEWGQCGVWKRHTRTHTERQTETGR